MSRSSRDAYDTTAEQYDAFGPLWTPEGIEEFEACYDAAVYAAAQADAEAADQRAAERLAALESLPVFDDNDDCPF